MIKEFITIVKNNKKETIQLTVFALIILAFFVLLYFIW